MSFSPVIFAILFLGVLAITYLSPIQATVTLEELPEIQSALPSVAHAVPSSVSLPAPASADIDELVASFGKISLHEAADNTTTGLEALFECLSLASPADNTAEVTISRPAKPLKSCFRNKSESLTSRPARRVTFFATPDNEIAARIAYFECDVLVALPYDDDLEGNRVYGHTAHVRFPARVQLDNAGTLYHIRPDGIFTAPTKTGLCESAFAYVPGKCACPQNSCHGGFVPDIPVWVEENESGYLYQRFNKGLKAEHFICQYCRELPGGEF